MTYVRKQPPEFLSLHPRAQAGTFGRGHATHGHATLKPTPADENRSANGGGPSGCGGRVRISTVGASGGGVSGAGGASTSVGVTTGRVTAEPDGAATRVLRTLYEPAPNAPHLTPAQVAPGALRLWR